MVIITTAITDKHSGNKKLRLGEAKIQGGDPVKKGSGFPEPLMIRFADLLKLYAIFLHYQRLT